MKRFFFVLGIVVVSVSSVSAQSLKTETDSMSYSAGMLVGGQMMDMIRMNILPQVKGDLKNIYDETKFFDGVKAAVADDNTIINKDSAMQYFQTKITAIKTAEKEKAQAEGKEFLAKNAKQKGVVSLPSGLQYKILTKGTGPVPTKDDLCTVKYEGKLLNGKVFDSSYKRNPQTTDFKPSQVIKGWTEALTMMPVGSKWQLFIPENLAYGERGAGKDIPPYSTLIFEVELISIKSGK